MPAYPRLLPYTLSRERLGIWLERNAEYPLRLVIAPSGFGKSTGLLSFALEQPERRIFVSFRSAVDGNAMLATISDGLEIAGHAYGEVFAQLVKRMPCEIILDGVEWFDDTATAVLERLLCEVPTGVSLIGAGSRTNFDISRYALRGAVTSVHAENLLFSASEISAIAANMDIVLSEEHASDIRERTDGWPIVVGDILRLISELDIDPLEGYDRWLMTRGTAFSEMLRVEYDRSTVATRDLLSAMFGGLQPDNGQVERLRIDGAPIVRELQSARILRVVLDLQPPTPEPFIAGDESLHIRMFGRFALRLSENEVSWVRRRDQQIVRYLLLQPDSRATKTEIIERFWPGTELQLAAQSLRTACSNIRKALVNTVGAKTAERFFKVEANLVMLDTELAIIDVQRFKAHVTASQEAEGNEDWYTALAHVAAAERIYRADLFAGEPLEDWFGPQREAYREMLKYATALRSRLRLDLQVEERILQNQFVADGNP